MKSIALCLGSTPPQQPPIHPFLPIVIIFKILITIGTANSSMALADPPSYPRHVSALSPGSLTLTDSEGRTTTNPMPMGVPGRSPGLLIGAGLAMGAADYFVGVALHELSHAAMAEMLGGDVTRIDLLPGTSSDGAIHFGATYFTGIESAPEQTWTLVAPKITDLLLMGGYSALLESGNLPRDPLGHLPLAILATGALVDFGKDIFASRESNDMVRIYNANGLTSESDRFPYRLSHLLLTLVGAIEVGRGWVMIFRQASQQAPQQATEHRPTNIAPHAIRRHAGIVLSPVITPSSVGIGGTF